MKATAAAIIITANERSGARAETGNTTRFGLFCAILDRIIIDKEKPGRAGAGEGTRHGVWISMWRARPAEPLGRTAGHSERAGVRERRGVPQRGRSGAGRRGCHAERAAARPAAVCVHHSWTKPKGVVSASADKNDVTVVDLVGRAYPRRSLFPAGRLDKTSTGFVLVTDDGAFAHDILAPRRHVTKTYEVLAGTTPLTPEMAGLALRRRPAGGRAAAAARGAFAGAGRPVQRACGAAPGRVSSDQAHVRRIRRGRERAAAHGHRRPGAGRRAGAGRLPRAFARRGGAYPRRLENRKKFRAKCWKTAFSARCSQVFKTFFT